MSSCVYEGTVQHRRRRETHHSFRYRMLLWYLDLDEIERICARHWLWSSRRLAPVAVYRRDYHGDATCSLAAAVRSTVQTSLGIDVSGPIRMLTQVRVLGYVMNPITLYYCFDGSGGQLQAVLAEVTNTPWNERHSYVIPGPAAQRSRWRYECPKSFHVSPFLPMEMSYRWRLELPGERLRLGIENWEAGNRVFDALLSLRRRRLDHRAQTGVLFRQPTICFETIAKIYYQAARLWWKRVRFFPHPDARRSANASS